MGSGSNTRWKTSGCGLGERVSCLQIRTRSVYSREAYQKRQRRLIGRKVGDGAGLLILSRPIWYCSSVKREGALPLSRTQLRGFCVSSTLCPAPLFNFCSFLSRHVLTGKRHYESMASKGTGGEWS